jgi:hypothetical protein
MEFADNWKGANMQQILNRISNWLSEYTKRGWRLSYSNEFWSNVWPDVVFEMAVARAK